MKATFFLIANRIDRKDDWRKILASGHEIGNHTLDHKHVSELTPADEQAQAAGAHNVLQKEFGVEVDSFAYPYTEISPGLRKWVEKTHLLARGGYRADYVITPDQDPDWLNIPSYMTLTDTPFSTYRDWIDADYKKGGWLLWMIHGLEGTPWGYQPISKKNFIQILDALQSKDIWVGTFLEVGSYFRAQKILEKSVPQISGSQEIWTWDVPDHFPLNVTLKLRVQPASKDTLKKVEILQGNHPIAPDEKGFYPIDFAQKRVTLRFSAPQ
jgi:hypothetical protein